MDEHTHLEPERDLAITIDRGLCIGAASCNLLASRTFGLDTEGKAIILPGEHDPDEDILLAAQSCPVRAIRLARQDGTPIYPA